MKLIGFCGPAGSGKTTSCEIIKLLVPDSVIISMADPLKDIAYSMGWNGLKDKNGRKLLQLLGTECGRKCIHPDIWVRKWLERVQNQNVSGFILCDDVRFTNEAVCIHEHGGKIVKVDGRGKRFQLFKHASERGLAARFIDYIVDNSGDKIQLSRELEAMLGYWNDTLEWQSTVRH